jgi:AraC family transcriptional regulator
VYARHMRTFSPSERALILQYIDDHLSGALSLRELSAVIGLRPSHFKHLFKRTLGASVHQYVVRRRIDRAIDLLAQAGAGLGDVADAAGFADPSHMARWMRRVAGVTPSALLRESRLRNLWDHAAEGPDMQAEMF